MSAIIDAAGINGTASWLPTVLTTHVDTSSPVAAIFSIPTAAISAVQSVPYLTFNLNSVALLISVGLAFLVTPVVLFVGLQCVWTAAIGPARKTLTSLFIVALSPVLPALAGQWERHVDSGEGDGGASGRPAPWPRL